MATWLHAFVPSCRRVAVPRMFNDVTQIDRAQAQIQRVEDGSHARYGMVALHCFAKLQP